MTETVRLVFPIAGSQSHLVQDVPITQTRLDLCGNQVAALPAAIGRLTALTSLNLWGSRLTQLPAEIGKLTALTTLSLGSNALESLPSEIGNLAALTSLGLGGNKLVGLPPQIGRLTALISLDLGGNELAVLPSEIGELSALKYLDLQNNKLVSLPSEIGNLTALTTLHLHNNQIEELPADIGYLTSLTALYLNNNKLLSLPAQIGRLTALTTLYLYDNWLTSLPREFGNLTAVTSLNLGHNNFSDNTLARLAKDAHVCCAPIFHFLQTTAQKADEVDANTMGPLTRAAMCRARYEAASERREAAESIVDKATARRDGCMIAVTEATQAKLAQQEAHDKNREVLERLNVALEKAIRILKGAEMDFREARVALQIARDAQEVAREQFVRAFEIEKQFSAQLATFDVTGLNIEDVSGVLLELGMSDHVAAFREELVDGSALVVLEDSDLERLGMAVPERARLRNAIAMVQACGLLCLTDAALETIAYEVPEADRDAVLLPTWDAQRVYEWFGHCALSADAMGRLQRFSFSGVQLAVLDDSQLLSFGLKVGDKAKAIRAVKQLSQRRFDVLREYFKGGRGKSAGSCAPSEIASPSTSSSIAVSTNGSAAPKEGEAPHSFRCPITLQLMDNPVAAPDGFIYEEQAIKKWVATRRTSPMTGAPMADGPFILCKSLRSDIKSFTGK